MINNIVKNTEIAVITTLVLGKSSDIREAIIATRLIEAKEAGIRAAVILEGLPTGKGVLMAESHVDVPIVRIAAACICCSGNLVMRTTLNRMLRKRPDQLYISLSNDLHLQQIREFLTQNPYSALVHLTDDIDPQECV